MISKKTAKKSKRPLAKKEPQKQEEYTAKDIFVLKGLDPVRRRPAMYIGSTGQEGLHHLVWECVDNSVSHQTPVIIKNQGKIQIGKIGEMIDKLFEENTNLVDRSIAGEAEILRKGFEIEALSFDHEDLKLKFQPIFSLIRHKVNSEIYKITLQNGRQIEITPYHSLFTLKDGEVLPIKGSDLKVNTPIVVPKIWPEPQKPIKEIDLIDEFLKLPAKRTESLHLYNIKDLLTGDIYQKLKSTLKEKTNKTQTQYPSNIFYDYKRWNYLPFNFLREFKQKDIDKIKAQSLIGTRGNPRIRLSPKLKINRPLIELLGIFAAEGSIVKNNNVSNRVVFSLGATEKNLTHYICSLIKKVFGLKVKSHYVHETARTIATDSYLIALIFKEIIKTGENSSNKKVPDLILNLNQKLRERYLIGYLAGDGYPADVFTQHLIQNTTPSETERRKFNATAKSKDFIITLSYLLSSLNKTYSYGERKKRKEKRFIEVNYKGIKKRREIKSQKISYALDFYWNINSSYFTRLPFNEVIEKCFDGATLNHVTNRQEGISNNKILTLLEKQKLILKTGVLTFLNSDLGILRVRKIERIKYNHPWVYDISVPNGENFVAGFSPIIAHNSLDEAMAGYAKNIEIKVSKDNRIEVSDNGRGIPVDIHPDTKKSALETVITTLHAGAKFGSKIYQVSGGLHGVGISVVCALSEWMKVEVCRGGQKYVQEYKQGKAITEVRKAARCDSSGTTVIFQPDPEIFKEIKFNFQKILSHLRQQAFLTAGVRIRVVDQRSEKEPEVFNFYFEGGVKSYLHYLTGDSSLLHPTPFYINSEKNGIKIEAGFQYTKEYEGFEESFANNIYTSQGGMHLTGFRTALTRTFNDYARKQGFLKEKEDNLSGDDIREGLTSAISIKLKEPQFEGQTKTKLGNPEARLAAEQVVSDGLQEFLAIHPQDAKAILEKCIISQKARKAAKAARETVLRKGLLEGLSLPGKLADCSSRKPEESELFLVEGNSAGGSAKSGRDRRFQAILPLRGKVLNVERARLDKILANKEIKSLIIALGTAIAEDFNIEKTRYHRVILMADADSVTGDTPILIFNKEKQEFALKEVKDFIENCDDTLKYQVSTYNSKNKTRELRDIYQTIAHPLRTSLYEIKTYCGYGVKVTDCHSIYVYEDGEVRTKKGSEIKKGDFLIFPKKLPHQEKKYILDVADILLNSNIKNISIKLPAKALRLIPETAWCELDMISWTQLQKQREKRAISRREMGERIDIYDRVIQQWEQKIDNVMPRAGKFESYLNELDIEKRSLDYNVYVPLRDWREDRAGENFEFYLENHVHRIKTRFVLDEDLAYLIGFFLGDGCYSPEKGNPNRFTISINKEKAEKYIGGLSPIIKEKFNAKPIIEYREPNNIQLHFHSFEFKLILMKLGLLGKKAPEKFIPDVFFNTKKEIQENLLRGLLQSDGFITVWPDKKPAKIIYGWRMSSKKVIQGIITIFRQWGIFPAYGESNNKDHSRKDGVMIKSNYKARDVSISAVPYLIETKNIWQGHKDAYKLEKYLKKADYRKVTGKYVKEINKDFVGLRIREKRKIKKPKDKFVYDFSVWKDQNFIAGMGGILLKNSDGNHIRTLLLTLFYRYFKPIIEKGYLYIAQPPLYRIQAGKKVEYAHAEEDKAEILSEFRKVKILSRAVPSPRKEVGLAQGQESKVETEQEKISGITIQRYKGLGEMNPDQLWETTMNPENRILLQVTIEDAKEADRIFDTLMGDEVLPRKKFIQTHAKKVKNLDI